MRKSRKICKIEIMKKSKNIKINNLHFQVIFRAEPEGGFTVVVPALLGCVTYGKSLKEATAMAREAIELYLEDLIEEGETLPKISDFYLRDIEVKFPAKINV